MEEDDKLKQLFDGFYPSMDSDRDFMARLTHALDSVEMIKERAIAQKRRNRCAVIAAAVVGFVTGVLFTLSMPFICTFFEDLLSKIMTQPSPGETATVIGWIVAAGGALLAALGTYELTLSTSPRRPN